MAITQVLGTDKALRINDYSLVHLVSSFDWSPNFNAQDIFEMGTTTKLDTAMELETSGSFEMGSSGNTAGMLARMAVNRTAGEFMGYKYDPSGAGGKNAYVFTQDDLAEMKFDLILHEKTDQKTFNRSLYLPCAYLTSFGGRVDAGGMASETFNFAGTFVVGLGSPFHDVRAIPANRNTATSVQLLQADGTDLTAIDNTTHTLAFLFIDGKPITNVVTEATYASLGTLGLITITTSEGYAVPANAHCTALVYQTTPGTAFPGTYDRMDEGGTAVSYVKGYQANIYLAPVTAGTPAASERWLKVQSMDYNVDLRTDTIREIGLNTQGTTIIARPVTYPLNITANVSVLESDWADWAAVMTGKSRTGNQVHDNTYEFAPKNMKQEFAIVVDYFTKAGTRIQNLRFLDLRVDGYGSRQSVGGRGEISWSFMGSEMRLEGLNP